MTFILIKKCVSFLQLDLNKLILLMFMWIFVLKDLRNYFFLQNNISYDNRSSNGNNNKRNTTRTPAITPSTIRIRAIATSESAITTLAIAKTTTALVTTMTTVAVIIVINDNKNNYTSGRKAKYLDNDPSGRSCEESDCDSFGSGNTFPPKQLKYTPLVWANIPVQ